MKCPRCNDITKVINSRRFYETTRRRRLCDKCKHRFTTEERILGKNRKSEAGNEVDR